VSFLLEVDSIYEVHDYIKSYLGETPEAHDFAKQFLERRQKLKPPANQQSQVNQQFHVTVRDALELSSLCTDQH
jgi:PERQ amino acid-rich with GYF domain-containing protein